MSYGSGYGSINRQPSNSIWDAKSLQGFPVDSQKPTLNQLISWDGIKWGPKTLSPSDVGSNTATWNADKIQGRSVGSRAPLPGQSLIFESATSSYQPSEIQAHSLIEPYLLGLLNASTLVGTVSTRLCRATGSDLSAFGSYATGTDGNTLRVPFAPTSTFGVGSPTSIYGYWLRCGSSRISRVEQSNVTTLSGLFLERLWKFIVGQAYLSGSSDSVLPTVTSRSGSILRSTDLLTQSQINNSWNAGDILTIPSFEGRAIFGSGSTSVFGVEGGLEKVSLSEDENAEHSHPYRRRSSGVQNGTPSAIYSDDNGDGYRDSLKDAIKLSGKGKPHENMPPFKKLPMYTFAGWYKLAA